MIILKNLRHTYVSKKGYKVEALKNVSFTAEKGEFIAIMGESGSGKTTLLNIIGGSMSVVGPRPERPEIAKQYCEKMPEFALRLQAKAGLTGYAQVYGKYNTTPYDKLQMDLMYIAHPSLIEDLKIMLATVKILFMPESTEGVVEGASTAMGQETK